MPNFIILHAEELRLPLFVTVVAMTATFCYLLHLVTAARIPSSHPPNHGQNARARTPHEEGPPPRRTEDTQSSTDSVDSTDSSDSVRSSVRMRRSVSTHLRQPFAGAKPLARKCSTSFVNNMNKIRPRSQSLSNVIPAINTFKSSRKERMNSVRARAPNPSDLHTLVEATSDDADDASRPSLANDCAKETQSAKRPQPIRSRTHGHMQRSPSHAPTPRRRHLSVTTQPEPKPTTRLRALSLRMQKRSPSASEEPTRPARPACPENSLPRTILVERYESPFKNFQWPTPVAPKVSTPITLGDPAKKKSKLRRMLSAVTPFSSPKTPKTLDHTPQNTSSDEYDSVSPRSSISSQATSSTSTSTSSTSTSTSASTTPSRKPSSTATRSMSIIGNESADSSRRGSDATSRSFCVHDGVPCSHPYGSPYFECPPECRHHCEPKQGRRRRSASTAAVTFAKASR